MFKRSVLALTIVSLSLSISSCGVAPGMRMQLPPPSIAKEKNQFQIHPVFVPITPNLLEQMRFDANRNSFIYNYHVGPQDILNIVVWDHPEFIYPQGSSPTLQGATVEPTVSPVGFLVDSSGDIFFPLIGRVNVADKTVNQIRSQIEFMLRKYIRRPQVSVRVSGFRNKKVYVMGEVTKAGVQPISDVPLTITDAINLAGGMNVDTADPSHIYVIRGDISRPTVYWLDAQSPDAMILAEHFALLNRDIVFVSTAGVARWNRAINLILPTLQTAWFTQAFINQSR